jgi:hypothetical protein
MKFLVDECLSPELTLQAHARGYGESSHVVWLGRGGHKDWRLKPFILDGDWTFVTKNASAFAGPQPIQAVGANMPMLRSTLGSFV